MPDKKSTSYLEQSIAKLEKLRVLHTDDQPLVDEIKMLAKKYNDQASFARACYFDGNIKESESRLDEAVNLYKCGLQINNEIGRLDHAVESMNRIGWCIGMLQGRLREGMDYIFKALELAQKINYKRGIGVCFNSLAGIYSYRGDYPRSLENLYQALKIFEETGDKNAIASLIGNLGNLYQRQKDYQRAIENHKQALAIHIEREDKLGIATSNNNIGISYDMSGDHTNALKYYKTAAKLYEELGNKYGLASTWGNIGSLYRDQSKYSEARSYLEKAMKLGLEADHKHQLIEFRTALGNILADENKCSEAIIYLKETLEMAVEEGGKPHQVGLLNALYNCEKKLGNFKSALEYFERMIVLEKEIFNEETAQKINNLKTASDLEKKEREAEIERLKNVELKKAYEVIEIEKNKSDNLLLNILPFEVAEELKENGSTKARFFEDVTIMFTDFKGFTHLGERISPQELVNELDACFVVFDDIMNKYKIEKIKTIGDAYMAVSGLPTYNKDHALNMTNAAVEILNFMCARKKQNNGKALDIRIGIHSGSVVAGVVGKNKFAFDVWGDSVNIAARMEQHCEPGKVNVSSTTYKLIKKYFNCINRGKINAKNKGLIEMFYLEEKIPNQN